MLDSLVFRAWLCFERFFLFNKKRRKLNNSLSIRALKRDDLISCKAIIDENQLFPAELLDAMVQPCLNSDAQDMCFVACKDQVLGLALCAPEKMTRGTWNLLLIAVKKQDQGTGVGTQLIAHVEHVLKAREARVLLVETSALPEYAKTRAFYPRCGFSEVARIPEYYDLNEDKVVFWKSLPETA